LLNVVRFLLFAAKSRRGLAWQIAARPTVLVAGAGYRRHYHPGDVCRSGRNVHPVEQFSHSESQATVSAMLANTLVYDRKGIIMEYLVVLATVMMIALYALIIERSLPKT
jgi:hypothetical protein